MSGQAAGPVALYQVGKAASAAVVIVAAALAAGCGGPPAAPYGMPRPDDGSTGSAARAIATGQFKGVSIPEPAVEVEAAGIEPIPSAPERRPVAGPAEARSRALEDLASDNAHLRFVAAREAGVLRLAEAVPRLAKIAGRDEPARFAAIAALGRIGGERAARTLAKILRRAPAAQVRRAILRALGATRERAALRPLLKELLGGRAVSQMEAARSLGALGTKEAVPALKHVMESSESVPVVRIAAAAALARLGDASGVAALERAAAQSSPALQALALEGTAALARGGAPGDGTDAASLRARAVRSIASSVGSQYGEVWSEAMRFVASERPQGALPVLEALESAEPDVALRARVTRAAWGGPAAADVLAEGLASPSRRLRAAACGIAGSLGDASMSGHLERALSDPSAAVRVSAAWALAAVGGTRAEKALERASGSDDAQLKDSAERALARLRARTGEGRSSGGRRPRAAGRASERKSAAAAPAGLVLERILTGADGRLFCMIRTPDGEPRLVCRGEEAGEWRLEAILPDGRGGGRVILSREDGREMSELRLEAGSSRRRGGGGKSRGAGEGAAPGG